MGRSASKPSAELLELLSECAPGVTNLALALREMVLAEAPEAEEVLYSVYAQVIVFKIPDRKGGAFCGVVAYARHVNLMFYDGARLADPYGALVGTGKKMRHIRVDSPEDLNRGYIRHYIRAALEAIPTEPVKSKRRRVARS